MHTYRPCLDDRARVLCLYLADVIHHTSIRRHSVGSVMGCYKMPPLPFISWHLSHAVKEAI